MRFRPELALSRLQLAELLLDHYPEEKKDALEHLDFAINEFREMKMRPVPGAGAEAQGDIEGVEALLFGRRSIMDVFTINEETCSQCGACAAVCHFGIIDFQKKQYPRPFSLADRICSRCVACMTVCPTQSIVLRDVSYEQCPPIDPALGVSYRQRIQMIKSRRSVRSFGDKPVPRELIERAIEAVRYSPTGNNRQNVHWLIFDSRSELQRLSDVGFDWVIQVLRNMPMDADWIDLTIERREAGIHDFFLRGAPVVVSTYARKNHSVDAASCIVALAYFDLVAIGLGLACCWNGLFTGAANSFPPVKQAVALPEEFEVYGSLMVGYPKYKHLRMPIRRPADITWR